MIGCNNHRCYSSAVCVRYLQRHKLRSTMYAPDGVICLYFIKDEKDDTKKMDDAKKHKR